MAWQAGPWKAGPHVEASQTSPETLKKGKGSAACDHDHKHEDEGCPATAGPRKKRGMAHHQEAKRA